MVDVYFKCNLGDDLGLSILDKRKLLKLLENGELDEGELKFKKGSISVKGKITDNAYKEIKKMGIKIYIIKDSE